MFSAQGFDTNLTPGFLIRWPTHSRQSILRRVREPACPSRGRAGLRRML